MRHFQSGFSKPVRRRRPGDLSRPRLGRVETLESRRVLAASVFGFDHLVLEARQFGSTIDVDDVEITDLSTNQVVYANTFDAGSTAGLTLVHWADGDAAANYGSPLNRVVDGRLRLESTGFQQPGAPLGTQARAIVDAQLPENFEARFTIYKRQASGFAYVTAAPSSARYARDYALMFGTGGFQTFINGDVITTANVFNKPNLLNTPEALQSQRYLQTDVRYRIVKQGASLQVFIDDVLRAQTDSLVNVAPTAITIPNARPVPETSASGSITSAIVGTLTTADNTNTGGSDAFDYAFVSGPGDDDNAAFQILPNGSARELWSKVPFDYETKSSYSVRIRSTDRGGLFTEQAFTIAVGDVNEAPTAVALAGAVTTLPDSAPTAARIKIADVVVTDDALGTNTLWTAGADAGSFEIDGGVLYLKAGTPLDAATKPSYAVTVQAQDLNVTVSTSLTLQIARSVVSVPTGQRVTEAVTWSGTVPLVKRGPGTLVLDRANSHSGGVVVEAGTLVVADPAALGTGPVVVKSGAMVVADPDSPNFTAGSLVIEAGGRLDIGTGRLTVMQALTPQDRAALVGWIVAARGDGSWNGAVGLGSSAVAAAVGRGEIRAIGWVDNGDGSYAVMAAAPGDTNLDSVIDVLDVATMFSSGTYNVAAPATWSEGDFTYDGVHDILDLAEFAGTSLYNAGSYTTSGSSAATMQLDPSLDAAVLLAFGLDDQGAMSDQPSAGRRRPSLRTL